MTKSFDFIHFHPKTLEKRLLLGFVLLVTLTVAKQDASEGTYDSECLYAHPQTQYCLSDFVVRATVDKVIKSSFDNSTGESEQKLKLQVQNVYKSPSMQWPDRKMIKVWVYNKPLVVGEDYLVSGTQYSKSLKVHRCNWVSLWTDVSRMQLRGIQGRYEDNCQCLIKTDCFTVSGRNICLEEELKAKNKRSALYPDSDNFLDENWGYLPDVSPKNPLSCPTTVLEGSSNKMSCFSQHAGCYMTSSGRSCRWRTDDDYYAFCVNRDWLQ